MEQNGQKALSDDDLYYTDLSVGEILKRTRAHYGLSLDDVERAIRIRFCQLEAIEQGDFSQLPGRVYAIGFVRSYAEYLGLDSNRVVQIFKAQYAGKTLEPELHFPVTASDTKIPPLWLVGVSLILAFAVIAGWWSLNARDRSLVTDIPPAPSLAVSLQSSAGDRMGPYAPPIDRAPRSSGSEAIPSEMSVMVDGMAVTLGADGEVSVSKPPSKALSNPSAGAVPAPERKAVPVKKGVTLNILQNSWVEIKDKNGKTLVSQVLKAGDTYYVPDRPDLKMSLGNAAGLEILVEGQKLRPFGKRGDVIRAIPLDVKYLKEKYSRTRQ